MHRFLCLAACIAPPPGALAQAPAPTVTATDTRAVADAFYVYALPIIEVARRRDALLAKTGANRWQHTRTLADDTFREVTTPNNDTIYSMAFIDLRRGPVTIAIPATGTRYASVHLMDLYSNAIGYMGMRASGGRAETIMVIGPSATAPRGAGRIVRSPTPWVWAIARVLVTSPADLPAAVKVQDAIRLTGVAPDGVPVATPAADGDAESVRQGAARLIADNPPPAADAAVLARFRAAGLLSNGAASNADVAAGFAAARERARAMRRAGQVVNGWTYPQANLGDYGTDYAYRASVAVGGLGAMTSDEAMYLRSAPPTPTGMFDGNKSYRLHFAADAQPPVNAFWSISLYERVADGGFYFVANPLKRYAFGDRTPGAKRNADGSLDIWIGHADPGVERRANWLPAPAGAFALSLRAYLPKPELRDGRWRAPAVEQIGE